MKVSSVICIIVSIFLIFSGIFVCSYARKLAPNDEAIDGAKIVDGQSKSEMSFSEQFVSKISLNLSDCTVTIRGNADSSYVKLINFQPNKYISSVSNKSVNVSNNISITDFINLNDSGISFAGVWKTLRSFFLSDTKGKQKVEVFISSEEELKNISLELENCTLKILNLEQDCDISIKATKSLIEINSLKSSTITAELKSTSLSVLNASLNTFTISNDTDNIDMSQIESNSLSVESDTGDVNVFASKIINVNADLKEANLMIENDYTLYGFSKNIITEEGSLTINEMEYNNNYVDENESYPCTIIIKINKGNISLKFGDAVAIVPETVETN